jgi:hypothetical protein
MASDCAAARFVNGREKICFGEWKEPEQGYQKTAHRGGSQRLCSTCQCSQSLNRSSRQSGVQLAFSTCLARYLVPRTAPELSQHGSSPELGVVLLSSISDAQTRNTDVRGWPSRCSVWSHRNGMRSRQSRRSKGRLESRCRPRRVRQRFAYVECRWNGLLGYQHKRVMRCHWTW